MKQTNKQPNPPPPARQRFQNSKEKNPSHRKTWPLFCVGKLLLVGAFPGVWFIQPLMVHWKTRSFSFLRVLTANTLSIRGSIRVHFPFSGWDFSVWPCAGPVLPQSEFTCASVLLCLEDTVSLESSATSSFCSLSQQFTLKSYIVWLVPSVHLISIMVLCILVRHNLQKSVFLILGC